MSDFTEKQLKILREAMRIASREEDYSISSFGKSWEVDSLASYLDDLLRIERERRRQRRKSLATERRAARMDAR